MSEILILEDDPELRELLVDTLNDHGHEATGSSRGDEAIRLLQQRPIDLLIADIRMAGPDGLETVAYLRQLGIFTPTLIITGYADPSAPIRALRLGVKDYLIKPFALDELLWTVDRLLEEWRLTQQQRQTEEEVRAALDWLLQYALAQPSSELVQLLQRGRQVAQRLNISPIEAMQLQLGLYLRTHSTLPDQRPWPEALNSWETNWEEAPWLARIGSLTEALPTDFNETALRQLQKRQPGRYDPYLLEQLCQGLTATAPSVQVQQLRELVQVLLACGDGQGSQQAFQRLLQVLPEPSPQRIFATLGLASLSRDEQTITPLLAGLASDLQGLAPASAVAGLWDAAAFLLKLKRSELLPFLQALEGRLHGSGSHLPQAQLALLLWALDASRSRPIDNALRLLMLPEHQFTLSSALDWLLPLLAHGRSGSEAGDEAVVRLLRQYPQIVLVALQQGRLDTPARCFVARSLRGLASARETLQLLANDPEPQVRELALRAPQGSSPTSFQVPVQVLTFGGFELWVASQRVADSDWRGSRVKHLAAYVALSPKPASCDHLIELFWPENYERGKRGLQAALSVIRAACRSLDSVAEKTFLVRQADCIGIPEPFVRWVDCHEFDSLVRRAAESEQLEQRCQLLTRAVSLYKGRFLEGCFLDWAIELQTSYEQVALQALVDLAHCELALQRWTSALHNASRAVRIDSCHLGAAQALVKAHLGAGHSERALQIFESFQRRYTEETGQTVTLDQLLS